MSIWVCSLFHDFGLYSTTLESVNWVQNAARTCRKLADICPIFPTQTVINLAAGPEQHAIYFPSTSEPVSMISHTQFNRLEKFRSYTASLTGLSTFIWSNVQVSLLAEL